MKIQRALIQAGKVTIVFVIFLVIFALYLLYANGFRNFSDFYLAKLVALGVPMLITLALVSIVVSLIERK